jgi:hypothetical protein
MSSEPLFRVGVGALLGPRAGNRIERIVAAEAAISFSPIGKTDGPRPWQLPKRAFARQHLVSLKFRDICHGDQVAIRAVVMQHKTQRPVQVEITAATREAVQKWIKQAGLKFEDFVFPSRIHDSPHLGTRRYARILEGWVEELGLNLSPYKEPACGAIGAWAFQT